MAEYIENVTSQTSKLDWAFPFQRTGAFPLDRSSLFSSIEDAQLYAAGGADSRGLSGSSYVGQPISVHDAETGTVSLYIINADRSLKEAGSAPLGDNSSIEIVNGNIQLKGFNSGYYAFVPAEKNSDGEIIKPSSYKYTEGFKENLEARVIAVPQIDGTNVYEIGWYEPSLETIDGVADQVEALAQEINQKADKDSVYTKEEVSSLIAQQAHLRRKIVNSVNEIDVTEKDAEFYIYMVRAIDNILYDNYEEYMVINGAIEKVGSWEVDLKDYVTLEYLNTVLSNYVSEDVLSVILSDYYTAIEVENKLKDKVDVKPGHELAATSELEKLATVKANAEPNYIKLVTDDFTVSSAGQLSLNDIASSKIYDLQDLLNSKVDKLEGWTLLSPDDQAKLNALVIGESGNIEISGKVNADNVEGLSSWITKNRNSVLGLFSTSDQNKLSSIEEGAQVNVVNSVNESYMEIDNNGRLNIVSIPAAIITDLETALPFSEVSDKFTISSSGMLDLSKDYVEQSIYSAEVGNLEALIRLSGKENSTLVDEVNYINERLQWKNMTE